MGNKLKRQEAANRIGKWSRLGEITFNIKLRFFEKK